MFYNVRSYVNQIYLGTNLFLITMSEEPRYRAVSARSWKQRTRCTLSWYVWIPILTCRRILYLPHYVEARHIAIFIEINVNVRFYWLVAHGAHHTRSATIQFDSLLIKPMLSDTWSCTTWPITVTGIMKRSNVYQNTAFMIRLSLLHS